MITQVFLKLSINKTTPNSTFEVNGSNGHKITTVTNNTTLNDTHTGDANTGRLRYTGTTTIIFHVACAISMGTNRNNDHFVFGLARNGALISTSKVIQRTNNSGEIMSTALHVMVALAQNRLNIFPELFCSWDADANKFIALLH